MTADTETTTREVCIHVLDRLLTENKQQARSMRLIGRLSPACGMENADVYRLTELLGDHYRLVWRLLSEWHYKLQHDEVEDD